MSPEVDRSTIHSAPAGARADGTRLRYALTISAVTYGVFFAGAGLSHLSGIGFDRDLFARWGLDDWVRICTGLFELSAGILTIFRPTRAIGAVGIALAMAAATVLHIALNEPIAPPFTAGLALGALAIGWAARHEEPMELLRNFEWAHRAFNGSALTLIRAIRAFLRMSIGQLVQEDNAER